jgi:DNA-binding response OmpR family regulator
MQNYNILWADDEIELLKAHIFFLEEKGYKIHAVNSGIEALEEVGNRHFDLVFLDENMPGKTGLETLVEIKKLKPSLPVIMITKSEEEHIMEEAIGKQIADYLIKPLNPKQILLSVKKTLDNNKLVSEQSNLAYQRDFQRLSMQFNDTMEYDEWVSVFKTLTQHELGIDASINQSMREVLEMQKKEANLNFTRFVQNNYEDWVSGDYDRPMMSPELMEERVLPLIEEGRPVFFILIDNLRYDQWKVIEPFVTQFLKITSDECYFAMLPTTTSYARNAIFSGLWPLEIAQKYPSFWITDEDDEGKNNHERDLFEMLLHRKKIKAKFSYNKIFNADHGENVLSQFKNLMKNDINLLVYNFVDMLSHARTDLRMIKELSKDEAAYRSIAKSWFEHSELFKLIKELSYTNAKVVLTTDHGMTRVNKPIQIKGDKTTNSNLRYKVGKSLSVDDKNAWEVKNPEKIKLPKNNLSSSYVFTSEDYFFAYPNNYNHYVNHYKDTFQHGGISMEEMIIPYVELEGRGK